MKDLSWADVTPLYDQWCRADVSNDELIDGLIDACRYHVEQHEELQHTADLRLEEIHRQARRYALLRDRCEAQERRIGDLQHDLTTYRVIAFLAVCAAIATYLRWGLVGQ